MFINIQFKEALNKALFVLTVATVVFLLGVAAFFGCAAPKNEAVQAVPVSQGIFTSDKTAALEAKLKAINDQAEADERLGQYTINMMMRSRDGAALSEGRKLVLARSIVRVSNEILQTVDQRHGFVLALHIESNFQRFAQSPTGPKGLGQLARKTFHEGMEACGVKNVKDDDVWETDLNLYAAACYFRKIMELPDVAGDPMVAVAAYNQGPNSADAKSYAKTGDLQSLEALKYVAKFAFLKNKNTDKVEPGAPAIGDLPVPTFKSKKATSKE